MADVKRKIPFRADRLRQLMTDYPRGLIAWHYEVYKCYPDLKEYESLEEVLPHRKNKRIYISVQWLADKISCSLRTLQLALSTGEITPEILDDICRNLNISNDYLTEPDAITPNVKDYGNEFKKIMFGSVDKNGFIIHPFSPFDTNARRLHEEQQDISTAAFLKMLNEDGLLDDFDGKPSEISAAFLDKNSHSLKLFIASCLRKEFARIVKKYPNIEEGNDPVPLFGTDDNENKLVFLCNVPASSIQEGERNGRNSKKE